MKLKKKTAMIVSFAVGILLFGTTALAEITTKSGYEQMKDAIKNTSSSLTTGVKSYTTEMSAVLKDNGMVVYSQDAVTKQDVAKDMYETTTTITRGDNKASDYYFRDKNGDIRHNDRPDIDVYYVSEYSNPYTSAIKDPFKEKEAEDVERIVDAFVGNLKEYVVVSQNADGGKELSGSLKETQIPALVNAITSFSLKQQFGNAYYQSQNYMPQVTQDIFVKEVKGKMDVNKDGIIQAVIGSAVLNGKDKDGKEHSLSFEVLAKVTNLNSTIVKKPDLTGKTVEKRTELKENGLSNPQMYVGTYKNNIVIEKDGKFVKIGERVLNITQMNDQAVSGDYKEVYVNGYENYSGKIKEFTFNATVEKQGFMASFTLPEGSNIKGTGQINFMPGRPKISFYPGNFGGEVMFDGEFDKVFE